MGMTSYPSYIGITISHYKHPGIKQPGWLMESIRDPGVFWAVAHFVSLIGIQITVAKGFNGGWYIYLHENPLQN